MRLFDALKKKKAPKMPIKELEIPPTPEAMTGESLSMPSPEAASTWEVPPAPQAQPQMMQEFPLPQYEEVPMPLPSEEMRVQTPPQQMQASIQQIQPQPMPAQDMFTTPMPRFRFYEAAEPQKEMPETPEIQQEVPIDVSQELLSMPELHKREHPEVYEEMHEQMEQPYSFLQEEKPVIPIKRATPLRPHISKQFITVAGLFEVGEQLVNMGEDLALAKDTVFRLTDLNEQEIERMAMWQALQQSMELRIAEIDKLLFRT